jgi:cell wall-associated NlpC family hydrolase
VVQAYPTLVAGMSGGAVRWVQRYLGVSPATGTLDARTRAAIVRLQRAKKLPVTGTVTARTWRAMGVTYLAPEATASRDSVRAMVPGTAYFGARVVAIAKSTARGAHYRYGGRGPKGFDCSGFVGYVMRKAGKSLPRDSRGMRAATKRISASAVRPGDLVFVSRHGRVSHVAIYAGRGVWYEASNPRIGVGRHRAWSSHVSYGRVG